MFASTDVENWPYLPLNNILCCYWKAHDHLRPVTVIRFLTPVEHGSTVIKLAFETDKLLSKTVCVKCIILLMI